ncbi:alanine racemase [Xenophilus arseniciresistens]|uniref:Alanine racemase n=2 Tax=Xenophilus arseniciresistens TaxID=1283306 RepID=A0AAE3N795_9BURK|nr:alanine racemase [Xenophilus arseniciresistens]MDA7416446.1 alanine racemase [Xenophilus arseniciresistens]
MKGLPLHIQPLPLSQVGAQGWNVLADDLPFPVALLKRDALAHNIAWMAQRTRAWGVALAPHGKTTMSPQLFAQQLAAGAWGISFGNVFQLAVGVAAGVRRAIIPNQVMGAGDLHAIQMLLQAHADLRVLFLIDSVQQLALIEAWAAAQPSAQLLRPFELLLEIGFNGGRTGCRDEQQALAVARAVRASSAAQLAGIECYEGLWAKGESSADSQWVNTLMDRVDAVARQCVEESLFAHEEVIVSAGGSAVFDLVAARLNPVLGRPGQVRVTGVLRSGCYVTHDHGTYTQMMAAMAPRLGCDCADALRPALEVWALVQSCPEPGLAIVGAGKRDLSFDMGLPTPIARAAPGALQPQAVPAGWHITGLNDQHAYLRWDAADPALNAQAPVVGERIGLGISHPCTTFDKWRWMPVVDEDYGVCEAISTHF